MDASVSRRTLIAGAAAAVAFPTGCARVAPGVTPAPVEVTQGVEETPDVQATAPPAPTIASLTTQAPFYVAHRGGRLNWPEMTSFAYDQCAALPHVAAIEISVCVSADGVLVCSHDPTTTRVTGIDREILATPWSELAGLMVSARATMDPDQPARPFSRLDDVLGAHIEQMVVFIEPKVLEAQQPLKAALTALGQPSRTVWKQPINSREFAWAKEQGFATWGYALDEPAHSGDNLVRLTADPAIDMVGVEVSRSDADIARVVELAGAAGKKTIVWSIATAEERARALQLGAQGLMTADIKDLPTYPL